MSQSFVTVNNAYPVQNVGSWLANDANSSWIVASSTQGQTYNNGLYYFAQQFSLTAVQAQSLSLNGYWLADDYGSGVYLNGTAITQSSQPAFGGVGGSMVPFSIPQGSNFVGGNNTLVFAVMNDSTNHLTQVGGPTPLGLRVLITPPSNVPEPASFVLFGSAFIGLAIRAGGRRPAV